MKGVRFTKVDAKYLSKALDLASDTKTVGGARHGAYLVERKKVISMGFNTHKTSPFYAKYSKNPLKTICGHAETMAIYQAVKTGFDRWDKATLYIARHRKDTPNNHGSSKPCRGCMEAIDAMGINRIVYTTNPDESPHGYEILLRDRTDA